MEKVYFTMPLESKADMVNLSLRNKSNNRWGKPNDWVQSTIYTVYTFNQTSNKDNQIREDVTWLRETTFLLYPLCNCSI